MTFYFGQDDFGFWTLTEQMLLEELFGGHDLVGEALVFCKFFDERKDGGEIFAGGGAVGGCGLGLHFAIGVVDSCSPLVCPAFRFFLRHPSLPWGCFALSSGLRPSTLLRTLASLASLASSPSPLKGHP